MMVTKEAAAVGETAHALVAFVDASRLHARGLFLRDTKVQEKGCLGIRKAVAVILKHTNSVDLLLPLLDHVEPGVRLNASLQLIDDHFDRVIPVLSDLDVNCVTEASTGAALALQMYGEPNSGNRFTKVEPSMTPQPGRRRAP